MKLVDSAEDQRLLEELLDQSKPPVPEPCQHLHYLLFTPFRYHARHATRYRAKGDRRGVFYGAERVETCAAEVAFYRVLFFLESPATDPTAQPFEMTAFQADIATVAALDIAQQLPAQEVAALSDPVDYGAPQALGDAVRDKGGEVIRYPSVRQAGGMNLAVMSCAAFAKHHPRQTQGWWFRFYNRGLFAIKRFGDQKLDFPFSDFAADPRVAALLDGRD